MSKSHVTKREAQAVCDYAASLCAAMRMPGWRIIVMDDPADEDANASIKWLDQRHVAQVSLGENWMTLSSDERRECITHEVMHLLHARLSTVVLDDSATYMHDHEHDDWSRRVRREFELMVDHLAQWMAMTHTLVESWDHAHER